MTLKKKILIIGADSKVAKLFIAKFSEKYTLALTRRSATAIGSSDVQLDLSSVESVTQFISTQKNHLYDGALVFASVYEQDPVSTEDYLEKARNDLAINVFSPMAIVRNLHFNPNSTILFFGDAGIHVPKPNHTIYTTSKAALLAAARSLAVELHDKTKVITLSLGPTLAPESREDKAGFYNKNLLHLENIGDGLINYCDFILNENNLGMTGSEIVYDSGTYLKR